MFINLAPIHFTNDLLLNHLKSELNNLFLPKISVIDLNLDIETAFSKERNQYYSTQLIAEAVQLTRNIEGKILMLVEFDLFIPIFTYLYGEAQLGGKHSIISICRLHEEFYTGKTDNKILLERTLKEVLHELGHNFGLIHCKDWDCVMHSSMGIEEVDIKGKSYCKTCASTIGDHLKIY